MSSLTPTLVYIGLGLANRGDIGSTSVAWLVMPVDAANKGEEKDGPDAAANMPGPTSGDVLAGCFLVVHEKEAAEGGPIPFTARTKACIMIRNVAIKERWTIRKYVERSAQRLCMIF